MLWIWSGNTYQFEAPEMLTGATKLPLVKVYSVYRLFVLGVAIVIGVGLWLFLTILWPLFSQALGGAWIAGPRVASTNCRQLEQSGGRTTVVTLANEVWMLKRKGDPGQGD
mgnify:CR=1 FL=1